MVLQTSGSITISDITAEFGGTDPHSMSEYYASDEGIPANGPISFSDFYGKNIAVNIVDKLIGSGPLNSSGTRRREEAFGYGISMNAACDRIIVGAMSYNSTESISGVAYIFSYLNGSWVEEAKLVPSDISANDLFGLSVDMNSTGDRVVVGSYLDDTAGVANTGSASVFSKTSALLSSPQILGGEEFSASSVYNNTSSYDASHAFDGSYDGVGWHSEVVYSDGVYQGSEFTSVVTDNGVQNIYGEWLQIKFPQTVDVIVMALAPRDGYTNRVPNKYSLVGSHDGSQWFLLEYWDDYPSTWTAYTYITLGMSANHAYSHFRLIMEQLAPGANSVQITQMKLYGGAWFENAKLLADDGHAGAFFGHSVAMNSNGDRILVGARVHNANGQNYSGAAYVFSYANNIWAQTKLVPSDGAVNEQFGWDVGMNASGDRVIIGAVFDNPTGAAYIFSYTGSAWVEDIKLFPNDSETGTRFGHSVDINSTGDRVVVSRHYKDIAGNDSGSVYIYSLVNNAWEQETELIPSDSETNAQFGYSVSMNSTGDRVIIGAWFDDSTGGNDSGASYVFSKFGGSWVETAKINPKDSKENTEFGYTVRINDVGNKAIVTRRSDEAVYVLQNFGGLWKSDIRYRYLRWNITEVVYGTQTQVSEFQILRDGVWINPPVPTNPGGNNPPGETPDKLVDGSTSTKWLDFNYSTSYLEFDFGSRLPVHGYRWYTANDNPSRDPTSWTIEVSQDGLLWTTLHTVTGHLSTSSRFTLSYSISDL